MNSLNSLMDMGNSPCEAKQAEGPSLLQTLQRRKMEHESRLADLNAAIKALEDNPNVAQVLELVSRAR